MSSVARSVVSSGLRRTLTGPTIHRVTGSTIVGDVGTLSGFRSKGPSGLGDVVTLSTVVGDVGTLSGFRIKGPSGLGDVGTLSTVVAGVRNGPSGLGGPRGISTFLGGFQLGSSGLRALPGTGICSSGRGAVGALTSPRGVVGSVPRAPGSKRSFSSSTIGETLKSKWHKHKVDIMFVFSLIGGCSGILFLVDAGYKNLLKEGERKSQDYIDKKMKEKQDEHKKFENLSENLRKTGLDSAAATANITVD